MKSLALIWQQIERGGVGALYYKALIHQYSVFAVANEELYFDGTTNLIILQGNVSSIGRATDWTLADAHLMLNSVMVRDANGNIFVENTDYSIDYEEGTITRFPQQAIPLRQTVYISYQYQIRCVDTSTGNPRRNCPQCGGKGFIWQNPIALKGLMHIPDYDSPLTKLGYFEVGDVEFTIPSNADMGVGPQGIDNLYLRDRIDVAGDSWRIMYKPQTIQMQNQYIAKKLHLRRLKLTPGESQGAVSI